MLRNVNSAVCQIGLSRCGRKHLPIPESLTAWVGQYHAAKAISSNLRAVSRDLASAVLLVACQLWNRSTINRRLGTPRSSTHTSSETILFNLRITNVIKFNIKRSSSCPTTYQCFFSVGLKVQGYSVVHSTKCHRGEINRYKIKIKSLQQ